MTMGRNATVEEDRAGFSNGPVEFLMPDISHYQVELSEARAREVTSQCRAIMLKATEGTGFVDPHFRGNALAARAAGLPFGTYHYVNQGVGAAQAEHVWAAVRETGPRFVRIDWESGDRGTVKDLARRLRELADVPVGVYVGAWARDHGGAPLGRLGDGPGLRAGGAAEGVLPGPLSARCLAVDKRLDERDHDARSHPRDRGL
jgi:hypothetical protein